MERDDYSVETTIKNLIEYDKKGQQIVQEAQRQRSEVLAHMSDYKHEMVEQYTQKLTARVSTFAEQAKSETDARLEAEQVSCKARLDRMQGVFDKNRGAWADEMFARCIGG